MVTVIYLAGCERSGTNYMQFLLKENFKDLICLTKWKHYPPRGFVPHFKWNDTSQTKHLFEKHKGEVDKFIKNVSIIGRGLPPFAFVSEHNNTVQIISPKRKKESVHVYDMVKEAIEHGTMKFLVNIKNPYGWHLSYTKHWSKYKFPESLHKWTNLYSGWVEFEEKFPNSTLFVRHEDMLKDFKGGLDQIKDKFNLVQSRDEYITVEKTLTTTTGTYKKPFSRKDYFQNELYIDEISEQYKKQLEHYRKDLSVELMNRFGYKIL